MAVLIKGKSIACTEATREYYTEQGENEAASILEVRGFATLDAAEALSIIELMAKGTKCQKPLYSAKINPETDRLWTKDEIFKAADMLEANLGLKGHARIIEEHTKKDRTHYHVLWNRFPPDGGPAKNMGNNYAIHLKTQTEIEKEFGLKPMMARGGNFKVWEIGWAKRYGFDAREMRDWITKEFNQTKDGPSFVDTLKSKGIVLCRGDKDQFVIILPWGQHKALSSMIDGRPTKAVMHRALFGIDIKGLPTVQEGKAQVLATLPKIKRQKGATRAKGKRATTGASRTAAALTSYTPRATTPVPSWAATTAPLTSTMADSSARKDCQPEPMPHRPASHGSMGAEQWSDYQAACDGKITWRQYFAKWGGNGPSP